MQRSIRPELLDLLPPHHERALRSRSDLRRINRCMGNHRWWREEVARRIGRQERVLEIGAGDGGFRLLPDHHVDGLDLMPAPATWPREARWFRASVHTFSAWHDYQAVVGNLVFHHFEPWQLGRLGAAISPHARFVAACEPLRARHYQLGFMILARLLGACDVTRHDGSVSIVAGFRGDELPRALGLDERHWHWSIREDLRGAYRMVAVRRA